MVKIKAKDYQGTQGSALDDAVNLADAVTQALTSGSDVDVSFSGMMGLPTSYFNVLLMRLAETHGFDAVERRVMFQFSLNAQRTTFQRSFDAVRNSSALKA